jgi:hypothetical protein
MRRATEADLAAVTELVDAAHRHCQSGGRVARVDQQPGERDPWGHVEFAVDAFDVLADGVGAQVQPSGDLAVGAAVDDEQGHLAFPCGERGQRVGGDFGLIALQLQHGDHGGGFAVGAAGVAVQQPGPAVDQFDVDVAGEPPLGAGPGDHPVHVALGVDHPGQQQPGGGVGTRFGTARIGDHHRGPGPGVSFPLWCAARRCCSGWRWESFIAWSS